jgi:uncharacterized phage infection (PIP) family protein YhgE
MSKLDEITALLLSPIELAKSEVDALLSKLDAVFDEFPPMQEKVKQPLNIVSESVNNCIDAINQAMNSVREAVEEVLALLAALDPQAEEAKAKLIDLPSYFDIVDEGIETAKSKISDIKAQVPEFVDQALSALDGASSELTAASGLCGDAIKTCTTYMMRAPPLGAARLLFMGVKSSIPAILQAIKTAKTSVTSAGTKADGLLDLALEAVDGIYSVKEQAIEALKVQINTLVGLIESLQSKVQSAVEAVQGLLSKMEAEAEAKPFLEPHPGYCLLEHRP